jgi:hypothetical protein
VTIIWMKSDGCRLAHPPAAVLDEPELLELPDVAVGNVLLMVLMPRGFGSARIGRLHFQCGKMEVRRTCAVAGEICRGSRVRVGKFE